MLGECRFLGMFLFHHFLVFSEPSIEFPFGHPDVEVIRRIIIGKCVSSLGKQDVIDACAGATQVGAGHKSGSKAAIHAVHNIFKSDETDATLLIDASNAFNSLKGAP